MYEYSSIEQHFCPNQKRNVVIEVSKAENGEVTKTCLNSARCGMEECEKR